MANNVVMDAGAGGETAATDQVAGGEHYQRIKVSDGTEDSEVHLGVFAEDAPSAGGETGIQVLGVRRDADTSPVSLDGDWHSLVFDANGYLKVEVFTGGDTFAISAASLPLPTGAATEATLATLATAANQPAVYTDDTSTHATGSSEGNLLMAAATPTDGAVDANDIGAVAMSTDRRLHTDAQIVGQDAALDVSGATVTVAGTGTLTVQEDGAALTALQLIDDIVHVDDTATHATGTTKGAGMMAAATPTDGSVEANDIGMLAMSLDRRLHTDAQIVGQDAALDVSAATVTVTDDGAFTLAANSGVDIGDVTINNASIAVTSASALDVSGATVTVDLGANNDIQGDVAHDAADSGNPMKVGHVAIDHGTDPTEVAAADRTDWYSSVAGVPFVMGGHPNVVTEGVLVTDADGAQTDVAIVAGTEKFVVTRVTILADNANTGDVACRVGLGTASVPTATTTGATGLIVDHRGIPPGGGVTVGDGSGILAVGAAGEDIRYTCEDPAGGNITIQVSYYNVAS